MLTRTIEFPTRHAAEDFCDVFSAEGGEATAVQSYRVVDVAGPNAEVTMLVILAMRFGGRCEAGEDHSPAEHAASITDSSY